MNKARRKQLADIIESLAPFTAQIEDIGAEEQEAFDAMPEGLQQSARGEASEAAVCAIESAVGALQEAVDFLSEAMEAA